MKISSGFVSPVSLPKFKERMFMTFYFKIRSISKYTVVHVRMKTVVIALILRAFKYDTQSWLESDAIWDELCISTRIGALNTILVNGIPRAIHWQYTGGVYIICTLAGRSEGRDNEWLAHEPLWSNINISWLSVESVGGCRSKNRWMEDLFFNIIQQSWFK